MQDCIFCKIASGEIPTDFAYQDDVVVSFADIHPKAPVHMLVVPKAHTKSLAHTDDEALLGRLLAVARQVAEQKQLEKGYKVVINTGPEGGQKIPHLHLHVLGGKQMEE